MWTKVSLKKSSLRSSKRTSSSPSFLKTQGYYLGSQLIFLHNASFFFLNYKNVLTFFPFPNNNNREIYYAPTTTFGTGKGKRKTMTNNDETTTGSLLKRQLLEDAKRWKTTGDGQFRVRFFFFFRRIIIVRVDSSLFLVGVVCSEINSFLCFSLSLARGGSARETPLFSLPLELTIARGSLRLHACRRRPTTPKRSSRTRKRKRV